VNPIHAIDDARGVFQPLNDWMKPAGLRVLLDIEIRVVDVGLDTTVE
jgi:hypothetical protein